MDQGGSGFARFAPTLALLYLAALFLVLLHPFNFSWPYASVENSVTWPGNAKGVQFGRSGMLISAEPPVSLYRRLTSGDGLTVELWLSTASTQRRGTGRIISYSLNRWERNFALVQQGNDLVIRLRTSNTDAAGTPSLSVADVFVPGTTQHIVVTYDFAEERVYVDGELRVASEIPRGTFKTWDPSNFLVFGNEATGGKPWNGTIAYAAIYERPLPDKAVVTRHETGYRPSDPPATLDRLLAYEFEIGMQSLESGSDTLGLISPMPRLSKPARVEKSSRLLFSSFGGKMIFGQFSAWDIIRNVVLFVPFGIFVFAIVAKRTGPTVSAILVTVIGASLLSAGFEALQYFLDDRTSSIFDFGANSVGALVGATGCWCWFLWEEARQ